MTERFNRISVEDTRNINGGWWVSYNCPYCSWKTYKSSWAAVCHIVAVHPFKAVPKVIKGIKEYF